jgi:hypothetical protein
MKHLLPSFDVFIDVIKSAFIASKIPHPLYEGCGVSLNIKWIIFMFALYLSSRKKTNICATQCRAAKSNIPQSQQTSPRLQSSLRLKDVLSISSALYLTHSMRKFKK